MTDAAVAQGSWIGRRVHGLVSVVIGTLLTQTPVTAMLLLGWLMRRMRHQAFATAGRPVERATWLFGSGGVLARALGGLAANIRVGFATGFALVLATLPFAGFWLAAWWAGWENSFNKGYEQAFVGPLLGFTGIAIFGVIMVWLPLALAHQAVIGRAFAMFELHHVRSATAHAGWAQVLWSVCAVILALPIFASRGLLVFAEGIWPGVADLTVEETRQLAGAIDLMTGGYIFIALLWLRLWSARIYARAVARATQGPDAAIWEDHPLVTPSAMATSRAPGRTGRWLRFALLFVIWSGLAVLIFVGQFLNHAWHIWVSHPFVLLPWVG